jgi:hypothetical protein
MLARLHPAKTRLDRFTCRPLQTVLANAGGSTWHASKTQVGSKPAAGPEGFSVDIVGQAILPAAAFQAALRLMRESSRPARAG